MFTFHDQVSTSNPEVVVDQALLPLIEHLWMMGAQTTHSCEGFAVNEDGKPQKGYIAFPSPADAELIIDIFEKTKHSPRYDILRLNKAEGILFYEDKSILAQHARNRAHVIIEDRPDTGARVVRFSVSARDAALNHVASLTNPQGF